MKAVTTSELRFDLNGYESISFVLVGPYLIRFRHCNVPGTIVLFIEDLAAAGALIQATEFGGDLNFILLMTGVTCEDLLTASYNGVYLGRRGFSPPSAEEAYKLLSGVGKL